MSLPRLRARKPRFAPRAPPMSVLLEPFAYGYMVNAIWVSGLVGCVCGFLSAFLMLKGWSLIGDALSHAIVPGVAGAYMLGLPFAAGAFLAGLLAAAAILVAPGRHPAEARRRHRPDLHLVLRPRPVHGLAVADQRERPDHRHGQHPRRHPRRHPAARDHRRRHADDPDPQVEGPDGGLLRRALRPLDRPARPGPEDPVLRAARRLDGRRADDRRRLPRHRHGRHPRRHRLPPDRPLRPALRARRGIGAACGVAGAYLSYFLDGATGGIIVVLQTLVFLAALVVAPKHGMLAARRRGREALR